jgi:hypothetical protein
LKRHFSIGDKAKTLKKNEIEKAGKRKRNPEPWIWKLNRQCFKDKECQILLINQR